MSTQTIKRLPVDTGVSGWEAISTRTAPVRMLDGSVSADWLIIGAGFAGLSAARRLAQLHPGDSNHGGEESPSRHPRRRLGRSGRGGLFWLRFGHVNCSLRGFSCPSLDSPLCIVESRHKNLPYSNLRDLLNAERGHGTDNDDRWRSNTLRTDLLRRVRQSGAQSMLGRRRTLLNN